VRVSIAAVVLLATGCTGVAVHDTDVRDDAASDIVADGDAGTITDARVVGVTTRRWIDTTRDTPANGDAGAHTGRNLPTEIWYPALGAPDMGDIRDAPPDRSAGPFPIVLFVHGSSGTARQSTFLTRALASAGYLVAAADFPLTAFTTPGGPSDLHVDDQLGDLTFLANQLTAANTESSDLLAGVIDTAHYVVAGHSTGGTVALLAAYAPDIHDARFAGAAALAPCACFFATTFFTTRTVPLLVIAGTEDHFVPITDNGERAYTLAGPPKDLVALVGGTHLYFTDLRIADDTLMPTPTTGEDAIAMALARYNGGTGCDMPPSFPGDPPMSFDARHRHTIEWVTAFADATLRNRQEGIAALRARNESDLHIQHAP
jgi:dienelactone hydrolase